MEDDPKVLIMGEDVGKLGGVFRVTDGLQKDFGEDRVIDTPLAESGIVGTAIGLAMRGYRPVCEIQFDGFVYPAFDQIVSQLAKMHYRSKGNGSGCRSPSASRSAAASARSSTTASRPRPTSSHTAGLKVVACSNPVDAYYMIQQAIASDDPVIFFEPKRRYWEKAEVDPRATPDPLHSGAGGRGRPRRHRGRVRADGEGRAGRGDRRRGGRPPARGHRPAHALPARHRDGARVGPADRPAGRRARGAGRRSGSAPRSPPG